MPNVNKLIVIISLKIKRKSSSKEIEKYSKAIGSGKMIEVATNTGARISFKLGFRRIFSFSIKTPYFRD
jgi:hypothetical protein